MSRAALEQLRAEAERKAREQFPAAEHVFANPAHENGPIVEVRCPTWPRTRTFHYVGWEL